MAKNHVLNRTKRLGIGVVRPIDGKHAFHDILTDEYNCHLPSQYTPSVRPDGINS